jgi:hypothetical protein
MCLLLSKGGEAGIPSRGVHHTRPCLPGNRLRQAGMGHASLAARSLNDRHCSQRPVRWLQYDLIIFFAAARTQPSMCLLLSKRGWARHTSSRHVSSAQPCLPSNRLRPGRCGSCKHAHALLQRARSSLAAHRISNTNSTSAPNPSSSSTHMYPPTHTHTVYTAKSLNLSCDAFRTPKTQPQSRQHSPPHSLGEGLTLKTKRCSNSQTMRPIKTALTTSPRPSVVRLVRSSGSMDQRGKGPKNTQRL